MTNIDADATIVVEVCYDCAVFAANADNSGACEDWDRDRFERETAGYSVSVGEESGFSRYLCDLCDGLAGQRVEAELIPLPETRN